MITENLSTLKINKLSQKQYDRESVAGNLNENEIYLTPDKSISLWQPNTEYKIGDVCLAGCMVDDWPVHAICTCIEEHTSDYDNAPTNFEQKVWNKVYVSAGQSYEDVLGNVIHTTYATKEELAEAIGQALEGDY